MKQINPEYHHQNKNVAYLVSKLNSGNYFQAQHVKSCSFYMPNWRKTQACVQTRISCEHKAPFIEKMSVKWRDTFSASYKSCWFEKRPIVGPVEYLRISRAAWRVAIILSVVWIRGGFDKNIDTIKWEKKNKWWINPMFQWLNKSE